MNDERPVFTASLYKAVISEDAEIGSVVSLSPPELATDADSGPNGQVSSWETNVPDIIYNFSVIFLLIVLHNFYFVNFLLRN